MYRLKQKSLASGFGYEIFNSHDKCIGKLGWPMFPQAKNARLMLHKPGSSEGNIKVEHSGKSGEISFEFLSRDWNNDVRFF
jgi:peptide methionine sulfoxide reductase MsrB